MLGTLANAAIAQSGCFLNAFSGNIVYKQDTAEFNKNIDILCDTDKCVNATTTAQKWEILKDMDTVRDTVIWKTSKTCLVMI